MSQHQATEAAVLPPWSSPEQLAEHFGVPVATVYKWNARGTGPAVTRVGRHVRYSRADVEAWTAAHREPAA